MGWSLPRWLRVRLFDENGLKYSTSNALPVKITDYNGNIISSQYPLSADGDSVYEKDIWVDESTVTDWEDTNSTGKPIATIPFNDLHTHITNSTTDNPKILLIHFNRTVSAHQIGLGCFNVTNAFSNVKFELLGSSGEVRTVVDDSSNNTKSNSRNYEFEPQLFNAVRLEFHTTDSICLSNITIQKARLVEAYLKAQRPDDIIANIQATNSGNLKFSLEEFESQVSVNNNTQLKVTNYDELGNPVDIDNVRNDIEGAGDIIVGLSQVEIQFTGKTTSIRIRADTGNSGFIFIGKTGVLADGSNDFVRLESGDEIIVNYDDEDNPLFAISDTASQKINVGAIL